MIEFEKHILDNGLKVFLHKDKYTPVVAMDVLYHVGAKDEDPDKTGFAHLFEHLMFGGSVNVPKYDEPLERVGGENNAFTSNDITNYYLTVPLENLETAFWLESDRMLNLAFNEKSLEVQRNVVSEEFKQVYLNQPYGDVWLLLREMAYKVHPYKWPTIGKEISHIEKAVMQDVKDFYKKYYNPDNAILVLAGNIDFDKSLKLCQKWFGSIENEQNTLVRNIPKEPIQTEARVKTVHRDVPFDAIYMAFHMCNRNSANYYSTDLLSDVLSNGKSSRLYKELVKKKRLFSEINAYITGDIHEGLFIITGKLMGGVKMIDAEKAIFLEIEKIKNDLVKEDELQKVKNKIESSFIFSLSNNLNKAMNIPYFELLGDANMINLEIEKYMNISKDDLRNQANNIFKKTNSSTLYYMANKT